MNKIIWSEWHDPLKSLIEEDDDDDDDDDDESPLATKIKSSNIGSVLVGPMGIIPINKKNLISNNRKFWEANTNFDITPLVVKAVSNTRGVETLQVLTRYMMIMSFGVAFKDEEVKKSIDKMFVEDTVVSKKVNRFDIIKKEVISQYQCWAIFVMPNGSIEYCGNSEIQPVLNCINEYKRKNNGCKIYTSLD